MQTSKQANKQSMRMFLQSKRLVTVASCALSDKWQRGSENPKFAARALDESKTVGKDHGRKVVIHCTAFISFLVCRNMFVPSCTAIVGTHLFACISGFHMRSAASLLYDWVYLTKTQHLTLLLSQKEVSLLWYQLCEFLSSEPPKNGKRIPQHFFEALPPEPLPALFAPAKRVPKLRIGLKFQLWRPLSIKFFTCK